MYGNKNSTQFTFRICLDCQKLQGALRTSPSNSCLNFQLLPEDSGIFCTDSSEITPQSAQIAIPATLQIICTCDGNKSNQENLCECPSLETVKECPSYMYSTAPPVQYHCACCPSQQQKLRVCSGDRQQYPSAVQTCLAAIQTCSKAVQTCVAAIQTCPAALCPARVCPAAEFSDAVSPAIEKTTVETQTCPAAICPAAICPGRVCPATQPSDAVCPAFKKTTVASQICPAVICPAKVCPAAEPSNAVCPGLKQSTVVPNICPCSADIGSGKDEAALKDSSDKNGKENKGSKQPKDNNKLGKKSTSKSNGEEKRKSKKVRK